MVPKSSILGVTCRGLRARETGPVGRNGLAREGILIFWRQAATVSGYLGVVVSWYLGYFDASVATLGARVTDVPAFRYLVSILGAKMSIIWCHWHRINVAKV